MPMHHYFVRRLSEPNLRADAKQGRRHRIPADLRLILVRQFSHDVRNTAGDPERDVFSFLFLHSVFVSSHHAMKNVTGAFL